MKASATGFSYSGCRFTKVKETFFSTKDTSLGANLPPKIYIEAQLKREKDRWRDNELDSKRQTKIEDEERQKKGSTRKVGQRCAEERHRQIDKDIYKLS